MKGIATFIWGVVVFLAYVAMGWWLHADWGHFGPMDWLMVSIIIISALIEGATRLEKSP